MRTSETAMGNSQGSLGFMESREQIVVSTLRIETGQFALGEIGDSLAVAVECVGDDGEFGGD